MGAVQGFRRAEPHGVGTPPGVGFDGDHLRRFPLRRAMPYAGSSQLTMTTSKPASETSTAAVFRAVGEPLKLERFPIPDPQGSEIVAKILCATICGSDLHSYYGRRHSPVPSVLGHEMVGRVQAAGPAGAKDFRGRPLAVGDRIAWSMVWSCGACFYCSRDLRPKCEKLMKFGHEPIVPGRALVGGMAEHCHLPEGTAIFRVPGNLSDAVASPANCATATVAAIFRYAGPVAGQVVVVQGAGMLGQTACAMAAMGGASQVIAIEPDARRRANALRFGAMEALDSALPEKEILARVRELSAGQGADIGIEVAGYPESIELGVGLLRVGGRFVMAGATFPSRPVQLPGELLVRRMIQIVGVYNYSPEDLESALAFLSQAAGRYPFEELVGRRFPLSAVNEAIHYAETERPPRVALIP
jgi:putative phosphonate catabolism associated alcohol dehydrogenase